MRGHHVIASLALATSIASAEPTSPDASDTRETAMLYTAVPIRRDQLGWRFRADLLAAALATTDGKDRQAGGAGTVSAQVGLGATSDCDVVSAGGQLATRSDDRVVSAQQWASVCPLGGDGNLTFDHRLEWDVSPRLLAAPRLRPGVQRRETVGFNVFGSIRPLYDRGLSVLPNHDWQQGGTLRLEIQVGWAEHEATGELRPMMDVVLRNFRHDYDDGPPLALSAITGRLEAMDVTHAPNAPGVASMSGDLARLEGLRVGDVRLGGRLGGRLVPESRGYESSYQQKLWVVGEAAASVEHDLARGVTTRLAGERRGWPAWDGRFVVDDRVTGSLFAARGRLSGRVDVAAASTKLLQISGEHAVATGGVTAESQLDLGAGFGLKLHSELGRSVYAQNATLDEPRWASETLLMLAAHAEHHTR
jgi:hypothetical protein